MGKPILADSGIASNQSIYEALKTQEHALGTKAFLSDGRVFYYSSYVGSGALTAGNCMTNAAEVTNHVSVAYASGGAAGSRTVTVTLGATAATEGQYVDGYLAHIDGTTPTTFRKIKSNPAAAASATLELTLYDDITDAITDGELSLMINPYKSIIQTPGNADVWPGGVLPINLPDSSTDTRYFWLQTAGPAGVIGDGSTFAEGMRVSIATAGTADAGQCTVITQATNSAVDFISPNIIGTLMQLGDAASDGDLRIVDLSIRQ